MLVSDRLLDKFMTVSLHKQCSIFGRMRVVGLSGLPKDAGVGLSLPTGIPPNSER